MSSYRMKTMMAILLSSRAFSHSCFIIALLTSLLIFHNDQPHRCMKQQVNKRNKQAVKPNEKKSCFRTRCLHPLQAQELFSVLT